MDNFERKSFDPDAEKKRELEQITKEQQMLAVIDEKKLLAITRTLERLKNEEAGYRAKLKDLMEQNGTKSLKTRYFSITYVDEHETSRFDEKGFIKEHPQIAKEMAKFRKTSAVAANVKITMQKRKEGGK
jgi:uncharacterized protein YkuJ